MRAVARGDVAVEGLVARAGFGAPLSGVLPKKTVGDLAERAVFATDSLLESIE